MALAPRSDRPGNSLPGKEGDPTEDSTLPNNRVPLAMRIFLAYLTLLDPEFKAFCQSQK